MKKLFKFLGIIAIGIVLGFSGCGDDSSDGDGDGGGGVGGGAGWSGWETAEKVSGKTTFYGYNLPNGDVEVEIPDGNPSTLLIKDGDMKSVTASTVTVKFRYKPSTTSCTISGAANNAVYFMN